jgi:hypothetical protein
VLEGWSWRFAILMLCVCVSVILLACSSITSTPMVTPTEMAPITLTVWMASATPLLAPWLPITATPPAQSPRSQQTITYVVNPGDTLEEVARNFGIETDLLQAANPQLGSNPGLTTYDRLMIPYLPATQTPQPLEVAAPDCYMTLADEYICLGIIHNTSAVTVTRISLHFALVAPDGSFLSETVAGIEQPHIFPGESAPYRVLFRIAPTPAATASPVRVRQLSGTEVAPEATATLSLSIAQSRVVFDLRSADATSPEMTVIPLNIEHQLVADEDTTTDANSSQIALQLSNPNDVLIPRLRIIACLFDPDQNMVGYRVVDSEALQPGETRSLEVTIEPMTDVTELTYSVYAEALMN